MYDEWDDILLRVEQEHGEEAAQQVSDMIDSGVIPLIASIVLTDAN